MREGYQRSQREVAIMEKTWFIVAGVLAIVTVLAVAAQESPCV